MVRIHLKIILVGLLVISSQHILAQDQKPKIALVLSGGGAKGIAHIPLLQTMDSLGIVPDVIIGTSMGSIVGGLYAMGYSADSIASIAKSAEWDHLLSGNLSLVDVSIEEKSEYGRYLLDLSLTKGHPKFNSSLINDQNLREFLAKATHPVYSVHNFDSLAIPYRAVATDIVNGKEVIIADGSLDMAMRASMAIPTIFSPVEYKNTLLIDGGVLNNFPVDVAKNMGYDFIIGSDVGGGMEPKEKLDNMVTLLFQTGMLNSNLKNPKNKKLCDILIDHVPYLTFSTGDFTQAAGIYEQGKIATNNGLGQLVDLANRLKGFKLKYHQLPAYQEEFVIDTLVYDNISPSNLDLVKSRANIKTNTSYVTQDLIEAFDRAMGTTLFNQISFSSFVEDGKLGLKINGFEKAPLRLKAALHYDNVRSVGLLLNITRRNLFGKASRSLISLDIAEQPRFRFQNQKNFGATKNWWFRSELFGQQLNRRVYINGQRADDLRYQYLQFDNMISRNINSMNSYLGAGINYEYSNIKPKVDPEVNDNVLSLERYQFHNLDIYAQYLYNNLNEVYYPTRGAFFKARIRRALLPYANINYSQDSLSDQSGAINNFTKLDLKWDQRLHFTSKITGIIKASTGFTFIDNVKNDELSYMDIGNAANYFIGGNLIRPRKDENMFPGIPDGELVVTQFMMINLGLQISPISNVYLTPHFNMASVGYSNFNDYIGEAFSPDGKWSEEFDTSGILSAGLLASYKSILGPVDLDVSWVNDTNKVRVFLGIGYQFNRSE